MLHHPSPHSPPSPHHNYGTRIRKNSILKPSARLRQCPPSPHPPRRIKPIPIQVVRHSSPATPDSCFPVFPIPGVMLHPEDASSKVLHAIGRSFLSVENRAMTIKDLAEMTLKYGLLCQNVSAASQAITTYIRNHMARCEAQQDHPLLLRHILSGTPADDDLVPALHSRIGGATSSTKPNSKEMSLLDKNTPQVHNPLEGERLTNFRRGTMVWYLSRAAGVSCPFARARIRLCEYGKEGKKHPDERNDGLQIESKKHTGRDEAQCGEKRKRLRRGCRRDSNEVWANSSVSESSVLDSGYGEPCADSSDDERPPKVKLTLRLRPSLPRTPTLASISQGEVIDLSGSMTGSSSEDDGASIDDVEMCSDPPDVPWSLPPYPRRSISLPHYTPTCDERALPSPSTQPSMVANGRCSPSASCSASPPPDSDHDDFDFDPESDVDWDSSLSFHLPAAVLQPKVEAIDDFHPVKSEPADIRNMLDAWEDLDCTPSSTVSSATVKLPSTDDLKFDGLEFGEWEFESGWMCSADGHQDLPVVKMVPDGREFDTSFEVSTPLSLCSPLTSSSYFRSSSSPSSETGADSLPFRSPLSPFATAVPSFPIKTDGEGCALTWQDAELLGPDSVHPHEFEDGWSSGLSQRASDEACASRFPIEPVQDTVDDTCTVVKEAVPSHESRLSPLHTPPVAVSSVTVVVHTCRPCTLDVTVIQLEGIPVYQTFLGSALLLRRIDTDFVNLSTILSHCSLPPPSPLPNPCVNVSHSCFSINGIWAPLNVARMYSSGLPEGIENIFLSDNLVKRFPTVLQEFYERSTPGRALNQFGPSFSASCSTKVERPLDTPEQDYGKSGKELWEISIEAELEEPLLAIPPSVNDALAALHPSTLITEVAVSPETPLSPTEEEMFRTLCVHPDWELESGSEGRIESIPMDDSPKMLPLRRSRRVADAVAARARVAPPRTKGPRHS